MEAMEMGATRWEMIALVTHSELVAAVRRLGRGLEPRAPVRGREGQERRSQFTCHRERSSEREKTSRTASIYAHRESRPQIDIVNQQPGGIGGASAKRKHAAGLEMGERLQWHLQTGQGEFDGEKAVEHFLLNAEPGLDWNALALVAEVRGNLSQQRIRNHRRHGQVESASGLGHFDFKAEAKNFFFRRHQAFTLQSVLASPEIKFHCDRVPAILQLAKHDANDPFKNLYFDLSRFASAFAVCAFSSEQDVDDGKGDVVVELEHRGSAGWREIAGSDIGFFRDVMQKLSKSNMLRRNQLAIKDDAQVTADRDSQVTRKALVEVVDRAQLLASNLPGLPDVPGLHDRASGIGAVAARPGPPYHRIDSLFD